MKIYPIIKNSYNEHKKEPKIQQESLNFEARVRVDKGLPRFYEANQGRMPITLEKYILNLKDKSLISPMEVLKKAFEFLNITETIKEVKEIFPFEPLFSKLKNPNETKASIGILRLIKEDAELLELSGEGVLKDKSNLTVYLLKKIFLENKTLKEINSDLDNDLNEDLKAEYKFKYPEADYIHKSTLKALGIGGINQDFRNSLRFTQDGYSDIQGGKVSQGLQNFWESLSPEERTAKAKKTVEKFEIWWNSHSKNEILEMIALQKSELEMLKDFKHFQKDNEKQNLIESLIATKKRENTERSQLKTHTKVGSERLKNDELFIKWATNNLKLFMENLSEADKDSLHIKRMQLLASRWAEMTPAERTEYISKIKSGLEPLRYTMIDAWNHSGSIIKDLYSHLKTNQIYKPSEFIYSPDEFSKSQSEVMTEFWGKYPEHCKTLGLNIIKSNEKVKMAISRGTFDELKNQILRDKKDRIKEFEKFRFVQAPKINEAIRTELNDYAKVFFDSRNGASYDELVNLLADYDIYVLRKLFSDKSPAKDEEKEKIYDDLKKSLFPRIKDKYDCVFEYTDKPFEQEKAINLYCLSRSREMKMLPKSFVDIYVKELRFLYRKNAIMRTEKSTKVPLQRHYISDDLKLAITAIELALSKVLYNATRDISFAEYSMFDNIAMLTEIKNSWNKTFPRGFSYEIYGEKKNYMIYSKPNMQSLAITYYSTLNELKRYIEIFSEKLSKEDSVKITDDLVKKLSLDYANKSANDIILEKLEFIISNVTLMDNTPIVSEINKKGLLINSQQNNKKIF